MIQFDNIKWRNCLSYGNNLNEFVFDKGSVVKIDGANGMGKSVLLDLINYVLFGKPYRKVNLKSLINSRNKKEMEVYLTFNIQDDVYLIERGMKPDFFRIYKNPDAFKDKKDALIPVSSSKRGYQQILEEDILQFNENLFNQVTAKSLTKNSSFMTLTKAEKRGIIENIFDIEIFTQMNKLNKIKNDEVDAIIKNTKRDIENHEMLIEQEQLNIDNLKRLQKQMMDNANEIIKNIETELAELKSQTASYTKGFSFIEKSKAKKAEFNAERTQIYAEYNALEKQKLELTSNIKAVRAKIEMLQTTCGDCPKIKGIVDTDNVPAMFDELTKLTGQIQVKYAEINKIDEEIKKHNDIIANERILINNRDNNLRRQQELNRQLVANNKEIPPVDNSKLLGYNKRKSELTKEFNDASTMKMHYMVLKNLYSDEGIKAQIINKYLPQMNRLLNTYLNRFHADMIFNFDAEFNEVVLTKYKEDFTYHNFSSGQKARIDLAVIFAFIEFAIQKNRKSNTNLLILDEITSGMDFVGKQSLHEMLSSFKDKQGKCIIVMNHDTDIELDSYDKIYEAKLEKGFSKLEERSL